MEKHRRVVEIISDKNMEFMETFQLFHRLNFSVLFPDLTNGEVFTLKTIAHCSGQEAREDVCARVSEVAKTMRCMPSAVSRTLKTLEEKNLIRRFLNAEDRRNTHVKLTDQGRRKLQELDQIMKAFIDKVLGKMDQRELDLAKRILTQLYFSMEEELEAVKQQKRRKDTGND